MNDNMELRTNMQISINGKLKNRLKNFSNQTGISMSKVVSDALLEYLPKKEIQHEVQINIDFD